MLSKTCEYAIRSVIYLAQNSNERNMIKAKNIANAIDLPEMYIAKILQTIAKKGYIQSVRGFRGGFYVNDKNSETTLADIIIEIDGDKVFKRCGLGLPTCSDEAPCPIHHEFKIIRENIFKLYSKISLKQFMNKEEKLK